MGVTRIEYRLWAVAERRAKKGDGHGVARTKNLTVSYTVDPLGVGIDHIESVRFITQPILRKTDDG